MKRSNEMGQVRASYKSLCYHPLSTAVLDSMILSFRILWGHPLRTSAAGNGGLPNMGVGNIGVFWGGFH